MIITIIGAGALGKAYGGLLSEDHELCYLMRSEYQATLSNKGFELEFIQQALKLQIENPQVVNDATQLIPSDIVIISLKTTQNQYIQSLLTRCLKKNSLILVIQNGIGNEEWISQFTQQCPIICGISTMGARRTSATSVEIFTLGELRLAPFQPEHLALCDVIKNLFENALIPVPIRIAQNYKELRWQKLLWNVPFSCLSVIYGKDAKVLATEPYLSIVNAVINELVVLAKTQGVSVTQEYIQKMLDLTRTLHGYFPSMYYDHIQGRPIEKEYIIDKVLVLAKQLQKDTPTLKLIEHYLTQKKPMSA
ncbi:MAG: ketopantoate reductase family protein [Proteobacteria bacterium]|nr:ketopantoate reductase family protein [Pseudomonadota bacterium]